MNNFRATYVHCIPPRKFPAIYTVSNYAHATPTVESDDSTKVILVILSLSLTSQCLNGKGRVGGESTQTGEEVDGKVRASRLGLL